MPQRLPHSSPRGRRTSGLLPPRNQRELQKVRLREPSSKMIKKKLLLISRKKLQQSIQKIKPIPLQTFRNTEKVKTRTSYEKQKCFVPCHMPRNTWSR